MNCSRKDISTKGLRSSSHLSVRLYYTVYVFLYIFSVLWLFSTRRNIPRVAEFFFVFFKLGLPESSHTQKNSAPRGIFRLVESSLKIKQISLSY